MEFYQIIIFLVLLIHFGISSKVDSFYSHESGHSFKDEDLTLLISITSAHSHSHLRNAARDSWLIPCKMAKTCDYRFFIDLVETEITIQLSEEQSTHQDMVFRGSWCPLMDRHPAKLNYGNVFAKPWVYGGGGVPYYQLRAFYKIDWKICFTKWAKENNKMAHYHVYVEDDAFVCTGNLIHQVEILREMNTTSPGSVPPFRTGDPKWDGFDDSSTFMSREVVQIFADHYPDSVYLGTSVLGSKEDPPIESDASLPLIGSQFNCSLLADDLNPAPKAWLSWGNSWMSANCDWRAEIQKRFNLKMNVPYLSKSPFHCSQDILHTPYDLLHTNHTLPFDSSSSPPPSLSTSTSTSSSSSLFDFLPSLHHTDPRTNLTRLPISDTCPRTSPILHHNEGGEILLYEPHLDQLCQYVLLVDKVKDPSQMMRIFNITSSSQFKSHHYYPHTHSPSLSPSTLSPPPSSSFPPRSSVGSESVDKSTPSYSLSSALLYHNYSLFFLHDGAGGWGLLTSQIEEKEKNCHSLSLQKGGGSQEGRGSGKIGEGREEGEGNEEGVGVGVGSYSQQYHLAECLEWRRERVRRNLMIRERVYGHDDHLSPRSRLPPRFLRGTMNSN